MKRFVPLIALFFVLALGEASAQCSMCRRVAETNYEQQQRAAERKGRSLNNGILYLLAMPYVIGAVGAIVWWTNKRKR